MTAKKKPAKTAAKPKTMAARRTTVAVAKTVRSSIVSAILSNRKKTFTSTEIATAAKASPRHSRRTLSILAARRILVVEKNTAPFQYSVANRFQLRDDLK